MTALRKHFSISCLASLVLAVTLLRAEEAATNAPLRRVGDGVFQIGLVTLDKTRKTVSFPAEICQNSGLAEYLLVQTNGKSYESVLATAAEPYHIHLAMLLLGAKGTPQTPELLRVPSVPFHVNRQPGDAASLPALSGDPFTIELAWTNAGAARRLTAEDCLNNLQTKAAASRCPWSYNGSRVVNGAFLAQRDGNIVALVDDLDALANNPRPGHDNDQIWEINSNALPPLRSAVQVTFTLNPSIHENAPPNPP